jgi:hypothetical protein
MCHNNILDGVKADDNAVTALIDDMRAMASNNATVTGLLERAGQALPARRAARPTETVSFTLPAMSLLHSCRIRDATGIIDASRRCWYQRLH